MKSLSILLLFAAPLPALAQTTPMTYDEAQRVVRAEAERWRFPLVDDDDKRYPDIIGTIVTRDGGRCETLYTITYPAFTGEDGKPHAGIAREVEMYWSNSTRHAIVNGTEVTLTWRQHSTTYPWNLETGTPERAQAFAAAADVLIDLCSEEASPKGTKAKK